MHSLALRTGAFSHTRYAGLTRFFGPPRVGRSTVPNGAAFFLDAGILLARGERVPIVKAGPYLP